MSKNSTTRLIRTRSSCGSLSLALTPLVGMAIAAFAVCLVLGGCGGERQQQRHLARVPVYAGGKIQGICRGDLSGKGESVFFHPYFKRGSREATICNARSSRQSVSVLYKLRTRPNGPVSLRLLRLRIKDDRYALRSRAINIYTTTAKALGFCTTGNASGTAKYVCTTEDRRIGIYTRTARFLGSCTPNETESGQGTFVCLEQEAAISTPA
jgi:hypothetical protein